MPQLLHVSASPRGDASASRRLGREIVAALGRDAPGLDVRERDLGAEPPPHPGAGFVAASLMPEDRRGPAERRALALSERLIGEIEAAEMLVLSTPMHNFTVPSPLKAWLDHVVRPGRTFRSTPAGKVGLLADRPVLVAVTCGGRTGDGAQRDFVTPYLRYVLATIGLEDVETLRLERVGRGGVDGGEPADAVRRWLAERRGEGRQAAGERVRDRVV